MIYDASCFLLLFYGCVCESDWVGCTGRALRRGAAVSSARARVQPACAARARGIAGIKCYVMLLSMCV